MHPAPPALDLTWQPQESDLRTATSKALATTTMKVIWITPVSIMGLCMSGQLLLALAFGKFDMSTGNISLLAMMLGIVVAPKAFPALIVGLAWRANPAARAAVHARIDPSTGIHITQGPSSVVHTWPAVRRVRETDKLFLVELGTIKGFSVVLPKRSLLTPEQMTYLRHLFQPFTAHK
ncbi:YcxB family protein [Krasilnikovia sp. MM14-A1259]|uniref:YcxB family protein n=1 Tax=Krasilnikovia sp. MM14-A1259 TaxID=3373539 RepID=UPI003825CFA6